MTSDIPTLATGAIQLIVTCAVFTPLAIIFVGLRLWARSITKVRLTINDWTIILALIFNCGQTALLLYASATSGIGHHITELLLRWPAVVPRLTKCYVAAEPLWISTNSLVKISFLHLYISIFPNRLFHRYCYIVMGVVAAYFVSTFIRMFFLCTPFAATWDASIFATDPDAFCIDQLAAFLSVSVINLVLDLAVFALPLPLIFRLQMQFHKKIALVGIFLLGFGICVITVFRIYSVTILSLEDYSYTAVLDSIFSTLEPSLGIVNACIPLLGPLGPRLSNTTLWSSIKRRCSNGYPLKASSISSNGGRLRMETGGNHSFVQLHEPNGLRSDRILYHEAVQLEELGRW